MAEKVEKAEKQKKGIKEIFSSTKLKNLAMQY
jgi:hypothetical protein